MPTSVAFDPFAEETVAPTPERVGIGQGTPVDFNPFAEEEESTSFVEDVSGDAMPGFRRAVGIAEQGFGTAAEIAGRYTGIDAVTDFGEGIRKSGGEAIEANPARIGKSSDVEGVGDFIDYAQGLLAEQSSSIGTSIAGAGVGFMVGGVPGAAIGGALGAYGFNLGDLFSTLVDEGMDPEDAKHWAVGGAIPLAMLDAVTPFGIARRMLGKAATKQAVRGLGRRIAAEAGKGTVSEGLTEGAQEFTQAQIEAVALDQTFEERGGLERVKEAAIAGAIVGGPYSGLGGVMPDKQTDEDGSKKDEDNDETAVGNEDVINATQTADVDENDVVIENLSIPTPTDAPGIGTVISMNDESGNPVFYTIDGYERHQESATDDGDGTMVVMRDHMRKETHRVFLNEMLDADNEFNVNTRTDEAALEPILTTPKVDKSAEERAADDQAAEEQSNRVPDSDVIIPEGPTAVEERIARETAEAAEQPEMELDSASVRLRGAREELLGFMQYRKDLESTQELTDVQRRMFEAGQADREAEVIRLEEAEKVSPPRPDAGVVEADRVATAEAAQAQVGKKAAEDATKEEAKAQAKAEQSRRNKSINTTEAPQPPTLMDTLALIGINPRLISKENKGALEEVIGEGNLALLMARDVKIKEDNVTRATAADRAGSKKRLAGKEASTHTTREDLITIRSGENSAKTVGGVVSQLREQGFGGDKTVDMEGNVEAVGTLHKDFVDSINNGKDVYSNTLNKSEEEAYVGEVAYKDQLKEDALELGISLGDGTGITVGFAEDALAAERARRKAAGEPDPTADQGNRRTKLTKKQEELNNLTPEQERENYEGLALDDDLAFQKKEDNNQKPKNLTPKERGKLLAHVSRVLRKVDPKGRIAARLKEQIKNGDELADGRYFRRLIEIAEDAQDKKFTLNHELIHALRDMDVFTKSEWNALVKAANANETVQAYVKKNYSNLSESKQQEEGVAQLHAMWKRGDMAKKPAGVLRSALNKISEVLERLGELVGLNDFKNAESIFKAVGRGRVGGRDVGQAGRRTEAAYMERRGETVKKSQASYMVDGEGEATFTRSKPDINKKRMTRLLGPQLYGNMSDIGIVTVKELFQNSFDAVKGALERGDISLGHITITTDSTARTITIVDDGGGMGLDTINKAFLTMAGTEKDTARASGGLGIAKMLFLLGNKTLRLETVRDGKIHRMETTGEQIAEALDDGTLAPDIETRSTNAAPGTTVVVTIPETYVDTDTEEVKNIGFPGDYELRELIDSSPLFANIEVVFNGDARPVGARYELNGLTLMTEVNFPAWGTARLLVRPNKYSSRGGNFNVLSEGLNQFSLGISKNPQEAWSGPVPYDFILNLEPTVKADSPRYPIALNRKDFSPSGKGDMTALIRYINVLYANKSEQDSAKSFGQLTLISQSQQGSVLKSIDLNIPDAAEGSVLSIDSSDEVKITDGRVYVNNKLMPPLTKENLKAMQRDPDQFRVDQSLIDPDDIVVHENVLTDGKQLLKEARLALGANEVNGFLKDFGSVFQELRAAVGRVGGASYTTVTRVPTGISFDLEYYGVNTAIPFKAMMINPMVVRDKETGGPMRPSTVSRADRATTFVGTMVHELTHHAERNHSQTGFIPELARVSVELAVSGDMMTAVQKVEQLLQRYDAVAEYFMERNANGNLTASGIPLEGDAERTRRKRLPERAVRSSGTRGDGADSVREGVGRGDTTSTRSQERSGPAAKGGDGAAVNNILERDKPTTEKIDTVDGPRDQGVVPGAERNADAKKKADALKAKKAAELKGKQQKLRSGAKQKDAGGMFAPVQETMFSEKTTTKEDTQKKPGFKPGDNQGALFQAREEPSTNEDGSPETKAQAKATLAKVEKGYRSEPDMGWLGQFLQTSQSVSRLSSLYNKWHQVLIKKNGREHELKLYGEEHIEPMSNLPLKGRKRVEAVLEVERLTNIPVNSRSKRTIVTVPKNYKGKKAKPGQTIALSEEETAAHKKLRKYFKETWKTYATALAAQWGYTDTGKVKVQLNEDGKVATKGEAIFDTKEVDAWSAEAIQQKIATLNKRGRAERLEKLEFVLEIFNDKRGREPYVPFFRHGDVGIRVIAKQNAEAGKDYDGRRETVEYVMVDTSSVIGGLRTFAGTSTAEKDKIVNDRIKEMRKQYPADQYEIIAKDVRPKDIVDLNLPIIESLMAATNIKDAKERSILFKSLMAKLREENKAGILKGSNNTPGYDTDFLKSIIEYNQISSIVIAGIEYSRQENESYDAIMDGAPPRIRKYAQKFDEYVNSSEPIIGKLKQIGYFTSIWGSPSSSLVNTSQTMTMTGTQIAGWAPGRSYYRTVKLGLQILGTAGKFSKNGIDLDVDKIKFVGGKKGAEAKAFMSAYKRGIISPTTIKDIMGGEENAFHSISEKIGFKGPEWRQNLQRRIYNAFNMGSSMFVYAEQVNRTTAWLATYREIRRPGALKKFKSMYRNDNRVLDIEAETDEDFFEQAADFVTRDTQFIGGKLDRPVVLRGVGGGVFQFKTFPMNYNRVLINNFFHMGPEGKMAGTMMLGALVALGGVMGLPFADDLVDLLDMLDDEEDPMIEYEIQKLAHQITQSQIFAEMLTRGGTRATGLDLSQRIGLGKIAPESNLLTGIPVISGTFGKSLEAYKRYKSDQPVGAAVAAASPFIGKGPTDLMRGIFQIPDEGLLTQKGDIKVAPQDVTAGHVFAKSLGFNPTDFARIQAKDWMSQRLNYKTAGAEKRLRVRLAKQLALSIRARKDGDEAQGKDHLKKFKSIMREAIDEYSDPDVALESKVAPPSMDSLRDRALMMLNPKLSIMKMDKLKRRAGLDMDTVLNFDQ